jgi:RND family efflux transporter MFP subunit
MTTRARRAPLWLAVAVVALIAVGLLASWLLRSEATDPPPRAQTPEPIVVATVQAEARALPGSLEVTGTLTADAQTDVASEIEARVVQVFVERGQVVAAGAVLAQLDQQDAVNQLREAEATEAQTMARLGLQPGQPFDAQQTPEARQARVTLERMEHEHQRYERLVNQGLVSRSEYELKRNDFLAQKEQLATKVNEARQTYQAMQAQRARVAMARKALADTTIRAPYAGLVAERHVNVGQYVQKGTRIATLVRVDPLRVALTIPEGAVASVKRGQKVAFTVQTHPGRTFEGTIAYVGPALRTESRALIVEALVPNTGGLLQPGLFATARVELPAGPPTPFVPGAAVQTEAGISRLFVVRNGRAEQRFVQLGRQVDGQVEVLRGLAAGERVAAPVPATLVDGAPVSAAGGP